MKHLANHFLLSNDLDIAEALCTRAIRQCEQLKAPENAPSPKFRWEIQLLRGDLHFILGKVYHKREQYDDALKNYFQTVELNKYNVAAHYCMAQIHYLNGNINAVDEALTRVLSNPRYKDCYEALVLLAKVKTMQGQRYEAMALYKRLIEKIYPKSLINLHPSSFQVAELFD